MKLIAGLIWISILTACCLAVTAEDVKPLAMTNKAIVCGDIAGTPTKGFEKGRGLYTIGLLVKTWGKVTYRDPGGKYFYIDDGSRLKDGTKDGSSDVLGIRVSIDNLAAGNSIDMPAANVVYVSVVGVISTFKDSNLKIRPNLRPRNQPDVVTLQTS